MLEQLPSNDPLRIDLYLDLATLKSYAGHLNKSMKWRQKASALKKQIQSISFSINKSKIPIGDKATVRELLPTDEQGNVLSDRNELTYIVHVFTGDKYGAGTDANVFLTIYGKSEDTGERELRQSKKNREKFERNQEDIFEIKAASLGKLKQIKIRHDDSN
ncbi:unnamed protein product, partial [Rotaria sordida]